MIRLRHLHDHTLREQYQTLESIYRNDPYVAEGDFAERLLSITDAIEETFYRDEKRRGNRFFLNRERVTELLYGMTFRSSVLMLWRTLHHKEEVWILFDNIDKGWIAHGVDKLDLLNLRCLLDAFSKLQRELRKSKIAFHGIAFIRNDVYELLVESMPDRGKIPKAALDWGDPELLREILRRRFVTSLRNKQSDFDSIWRGVAETHILGGQESSTYLLDRCLMRPRALIDLLGHCRSHAINLGHDRIREDDFVEGEKAFSTDLANQISFEIQDVRPDVEDALFAFIESPHLLDTNQLTERLALITTTPEEADELTELLLWYGFLGILRKSTEVTYIYNVSYEMKKLKALINVRPALDLVYAINPAFWRGLDIDVNWKALIKPS